MSESERWFSVAYAIWLIGIFAYFVPAATWSPVSRFDLTRAVVEEQTLSIDAFHENTGDRAFAGGHWYTDKAPIPSLIATPVYGLYYLGEMLRGEKPEYTVLATSRTPALRVWVNGSFQRGLYVCTLFTAAAAAALLGVVLFSMLARRYSPRTALLASAGTVLGTPLLPYATSFYGHGIAAAFLTAAFAALFGEPSSPPSGRRVRIAGACFTLAIGSEYIAALPGLLIVVSFLATEPRGGVVRRVVELTLGSALPAFTIAAYHVACFGGVFRTGYSYIVSPEFSKGHASGLMGIHAPTLEGISGLLIGPSRGLLLISPFAVLALGLGLISAVRSADRAARVALIAFTALFLANAGYYMWWGGAAAGPRHLVPCLGFLAFGLAEALDGRWRWLARALLLVSVSNLLVITAVGLEAPDRGNILFDYAYPRFFRGGVASLSGASNLGIRVGLGRGASLGPLLAWLLLGARFLFRHVDDWTAREPSAKHVGNAEESVGRARAETT